MSQASPPPGAVGLSIAVQRLMDATAVDRSVLFIEIAPQFPPLSSSVRAQDQDDRVLQLHRTKTTHSEILKLRIDVDRKREWISNCISVNTTPQDTCMHVSDSVHGHYKSSLTRNWLFFRTRSDAAADVLVCSRGGGGLLMERMEIVNELWSANIKVKEPWRTDVHAILLSSHTLKKQCPWVRSVSLLLRPYNAKNDWIFPSYLQHKNGTRTGNIRNDSRAPQIYPDLSFGWLLVGNVKNLIMFCGLVRTFVIWALRTF